MIVSASRCASLIIWARSATMAFGLAHLRRNFFLDFIENLPDLFAVHKYLSAGKRQLPALIQNIHTSRR